MNNYHKPSKGKTIASHSNNNNPKNYRSQKIKLNSIPLGNLFKHIGEVISNSNNNNNNDFNHIFSKFNVATSIYDLIVDRNEEKVKKSERPKSKK